MGQPHQRKRGAVRQFRRVVPADLRTRLGQREIIRSYGAAGRGEARVISERLWSATEVLFMTIRLNPNLSRAEIEAFSTRLLDDLRFENEREYSRVAVAPCAADTFPVVTVAEAYELDVDNLKIALARNDLEAGHRLLETHFGDAALELDKQDRRTLARAAMRVRIQADGEAASHIRAEVLPHLPSVAAYGVQGELAAPAPATFANKGQATAGAMLRRQNEPFSALWPDYVADQVSIEAWTAPVARQNEASRKLFVAVCGDKPLGAYGPLDGTTFRSMVLGLPPTYDKSPAYRTFYQRGDIAGLVAAAKEAGAKTVVPKTFNRHFSALNPMWGWAANNEALPKGAASIFADLFIPKKKKKHGGEQAAEQRPMWSTPQLATILATPLMLGCLSRRFCREPGPSVFRDERYWGILLGVHTGMRREEIFQLRVRHVKREEETGIWHVDLFSPGLRLKDSGTPRYVPFHDNILALGFIEVRIAGRAADEMLFPEAKRSQSDGKFGDLFGKWFGLWRRHYGVPEDMDFHSFRHTVETLLVRAGATRAVAEEFIGHEDDDRRSEFRRYNKGQTLTLLKAAIDRVAFPIDVAALNAAARRRDPTNLKKVEGEQTKHHRKAEENVHGQRPVV